MNNKIVECRSAAKAFANFDVLPTFQPTDEVRVLAARALNFYADYLEDKEIDRKDQE